MRTMSFVLVLAALVGLSWPAFGADPGRDLPKITVSGEAQVSVVPDKILVSFGIQTLDNDIVVAKQKNTAIFKRTIAAIRALGVADKDVQTSYLDVVPRYRDPYEASEIIGYFVRNAFVVTLNDPAKIEKLIGAALSSGVTNVQGVDFQTTRLKENREKARDLALKAAKEKAQLMAAALGRRVGAPLQISDGYGGSWYNSGWWGRGPSQNMSQNVVQASAGQGAEISETVALGKISVRANVSVTFELEKE